MKKIIINKEKVKNIIKFIKEKRLEIAVAVFLGIATFLVAWAGWIGSLHEGNQATHFTESNNLAAEGNSEYNVEAQIYISDLFSWNTILNLQLDMENARESGDENGAKLIEKKIQKIKSDSCSPKLLEAMNKMDSKNQTSPFENEDYVNSYFEGAKELLAKSQGVLEEGKQDNLWADSYKLATVIYSLVLFLLGIVGVLKDYYTRKMVLIFSVCILIFGIIYMLTLPMPTGFDISKFFSFK